MTPEATYNGTTIPLVYVAILFCFACCGAKLSLIPSNDDVLIIDCKQGIAWLVPYFHQIAKIFRTGSNCIVKDCSLMNHSAIDFFFNWWTNTSRAIFLYKSIVKLHLQSQIPPRCYKWEGELIHSTKDSIKKEFWSDFRRPLAWTLIISLATRIMSVRVTK